MELDLPVVSTTLGPEWASKVNEALTTIDSHDHSDGKGALVTPAGMLINDDLDFVDNSILDTKSVGLAAQVAAITSLLGSLQRVGGNLWYINSSGAGIQLTSGSSIISAGSGVLTPSVISSYPYDILVTDAQAVLIIDTASARVANLPAASTAMMVGLKDGVGSAGLNNITVNPDGTDLIDGVNTAYKIQEDFGCKFFLSDGVSKWYVV